MSTSVEESSSLLRNILIGSTSSIPRIFITIFFLLLARWILRGFYRLYFHPLSRFPGPKFSAFTRLPYLRAQYTGAPHTYIRQLHERYGDIVRVFPDELSFNDPQAWRDIYGHGSKGTRGSAPPKHWLRYNSTSKETVDLVAAQGDAHAKVRRIFLPAFSDRALKQQEPLFMKYVHQLVGLMRHGIQEDQNQRFDMVRLYNYTTFDIMGDLTFGEPLKMLAASTYDPWVSVIFATIKTANRLSLLKLYPPAQRLFDLLAAKKIQTLRKQHADYAAQRVTKRLQHGRASAGVDLWDLVLSQEEGKGLTRKEMDANASMFMIAGTETTATLLSGLTYLLLKNPEKMHIIVGEIRSAFAKSTDISMETTAALPYVNACIKEALRMYPPVPVGLPHLTPPEGSTICGEYVPAGITVTAPHHAMYYSAKLFRDAESFVPERWMGDERYAADQRAAVQPFSVGSRDCLGKNMAYHEMRLIITNVLYNFDLELCPESERWMEQDVFTLWEKRALMVRARDVQTL